MALEVLEEYTIEGTGEVIKRGDNVMIKPGGDDKNIFIGRVEVFNRSGSNVLAQYKTYFGMAWGYPPYYSWACNKQICMSTEEPKYIPAETIVRKCTVYSEKKYQQKYAGKEVIDPYDFYCSRLFDPTTRQYTDLDCHCQVPRNINRMFQCRRCHYWFHPECVGLTLGGTPCPVPTFSSELYSQCDECRMLRSRPFEWGIKMSDVGPSGSYFRPRPPM